MFFVASQMPKSVGLQRYLTSIRIDDWIKNDAFSFKWWFLLGLIFVSLLVWWNLLDKFRLNEVLLYVTLATLIVLVIAEYGTELTLWDYPTDIIPIFLPLSSINLMILPLIYSLIYQYFVTKKSFVWATLIITAVICFIIEPILVWGGFYQLIHWKYYYSFAIYVSLSILIRIVVIKIYSTTKTYKNIR